MAVSLLTGIGRLLALLVFVTAAYRALLTVAFLIERRRRAQPPRAEVALRFATLIPAHDEILLVGASIDSVRRAYANADGCDVYVIADNCSDATAQVAAHHGAKVLVRQEPQRGKGWALDWAVSQIDLRAYDAVAVIDADNLVDPDFFREMTRRLADGARVLQGYDGIANPEESPLTRLISITSVMKNLLYNGGKAALGLSPHLMGTGMVFRAETLAAHGWRSHSIVENIEQSLLLLLAGERIEHVPEARVYAQEAATFEQALSQRQRWASGQAALSRRALHTVARGITTRRWSLIDAARGPAAADPLLEAPLLHDRSPRHLARDLAGRLMDDRAGRAGRFVSGVRVAHGVALDAAAAAGPRLGAGCAGIPRLEGVDRRARDPRIPEGGVGAHGSTRAASARCAASRRRRPPCSAGAIQANPPASPTPRAEEQPERPRDERGRAGRDGIEGAEMKQRTRVAAGERVLEAKGALSRVGPYATEIVTAEAFVPKRE